MSHKPRLLILLIGCFFFAWTAQAHKIVLLTSLDPEENRPPLRFSSWNINEKLAEKFHDEMWKFPYPIEKEVIHFANAEKLYKVLKDEEVKAIIWVGHAGFADGQNLGSLRSIIDYKGRDLKAVFQAIAPHLKYLALVGCRGELFINDWRDRGHLDHTPELITFGREVRTDARKGLKLAMRNLQQLLRKKGDFLSNDASSSPVPYRLSYQRPHKDYLKLSVSRENNKNTELDSVQILQRGRLIGFMPANQTHTEVFIKKAKRPSDLKIVVESGYASSASDVNLGLFSIKTESPIRWNLFQTPNGKPIGVGRHIYRAKINRP